MGFDEADFVSHTETPASETEFAQGRVSGRFYTSKTFANRNTYSSDFGQPSRFAYEVFDDDGNASVLRRDGEEWVVSQGDTARTQIKVLVSRQAGSIVDLWIQRVPAPGSGGQVKDILRLRRDTAIRFAQFMQLVEALEPDGAESGVRLDEETLRSLFKSPESVEIVYGENVETFRALIQNDANAKDVVALAGRRQTLERFRRLLRDDIYFDAEADTAHGPESVWQGFFEANPWILGIGLGSQLLTSWSREKLEQVVAGNAIDRVGKRSDALLRTSGIIKSMVFAEIKHHRTRLLREEYRPGVWSPSKELVGGASQVQVTVQRAVADLTAAVGGKDSSGFESGETTYLYRPKSFLVVGQLGEFTNDSGDHHRDKIASFELHRRHLQQPEIVTFDELLARAEWIVDGNS